MNSKISFRIIELSSEYISLRENNMDEHLKLCEEYRLFIVENRQQFDSTEVYAFSVCQREEFFNHLPLFA